MRWYVTLRRANGIVIENCLGKHSIIPCNERIRQWTGTCCGWRVRDSVSVSFLGRVFTQPNTLVLHHLVKVNIDCISKE